MSWLVSYLMTDTHLHISAAHTNLHVIQLPLADILSKLMLLYVNPKFSLIIKCYSHCAFLNLLQLTPEVLLV